MTLWISFTRDLADPYVLSEDCAAEGVFIGNGTVRPDFQVRRTHAPDSPHTSGKMLLAAVHEQGEIEIPLIARGADNEAIQAHIDELEDALWQFIFSTRLHEDGVEWVWSSEPAVPAWGPITGVGRAARVRVGAVSIPVNPPGSP